MPNEPFDYEAYKAEMERRIKAGMNLKLERLAGIPVQGYCILVCDFK